MSCCKPKSLEEYRDWLRKEHDICVQEKCKRYYEAVSKSIHYNFGNSGYWKSLHEELNNTDKQYRIDTGYELLINKQLPDLMIKPYESFINKTYRKNIVLNENWPNEPADGWYLPLGCHERINDMIRTCFTVKYLDGVSHLANVFGSAAQKYNYDFHCDYEAKNEGYYAAHFYLKYPCEIQSMDWDTNEATFQVEMQITTQLQEVIRKLLHKHYERNRISSTVIDSQWQWDYTSKEFATNYLGHILHYLEGMIMDVRTEGEGK